MKNSDIVEISDKIDEWVKERNPDDVYPIVELIAKKGLQFLFFPFLGDTREIWGERAWELDAIFRANNG